MATTTEQPRYAVARWSHRLDGWKRLRSYPTYEAADAALDRWSDLWPHAWVEIVNINGDELA